MPNKGIVVAEVLEVGPHPNAERIFLAWVDLGDAQKHKIVYGGTRRLQRGDLVTAAPPGSRLYNGMKLRRRKYRGEPSFGMLCSARELGWTADGRDEVCVLSKGSPGRLAGRHSRVRASRRS